MRLDPQLSEDQIKIEQHARDFGLDFFPTHFEVVEWDQLTEIASYGGFPTRYPHWRHGMAYEGLLKSYVYGVSKIYELVINNDPCYAYLMASNDHTIQKLVMAHVYGHCDFFKNNLTFSRTRRNMIDVMANHAIRVRRYIDKYGFGRVEKFIDACLSLENLIDPYLPFSKPMRREEPVKEDETTHVDVQKLKAKDYMDPYINPPAVIESRRLKAIEEHKKATKFPSRPQKDVLLFLINYAPLRRWQRDILNIVRDEAYYFAPQAMTKIMNEGWACFWHSQIMTGHVCTDAEIIDYASTHSATVAAMPGQINPYKLGLDLFRDIEERWNRGQYGKEWESCDDMHRKATWDTREMSGRKKIFEVRRIYNDLGFIDEFLTEDFCRRKKLFTFEYNESKDDYQIASREFKAVKEKILASLTNMGQPCIVVDDGNYLNRGELLLYHDHAGVDLDRRYIEHTMRNLYTLWNRPVNLQSVADERPVLYTWDGERLSEKEEMAAKE